MAFLMAKKLKMTEVFSEDGKNYPATVLSMLAPLSEEVAPVFQAGDLVTVSAISKGKGFQGVVKRHGFKGGSRTHGQKHSEREPGAIGGGARAGGRVAKGMRMAGRMGGDRITVKNLRVLKFDTGKKEIYLGGAVPGRKGTLVEIKN